MFSGLVVAPERYLQAYLRALCQLLLFTIPGVGFLITNAEQLVPAVLGPQWVPSIPIFLWLSFAAVHQPLSATTGWLFISQSRPGERSEERRVGKECGGTCRSRWSPYH